jgi:3-hydroxymyristoyl/3-hydroxydecanoyl-(acyl carrier protein) dehydratase
MKFLRAVRPGEEISLRAAKLAEVGDLMQFAVTASVAGEIAAEGHIVLTVAPPRDALN